MGSTDAQVRASKKYEQDKVERVMMRVSKGKKAQIQELADKNDESINGLLNRLVDEALERG